MKCYNYEQAHSDEGIGDDDVDELMKEGVDADEIFENDDVADVVVVVH